mmetsp:Transcript_36971/g.105148  ORF Transcript_36971/g.105148 Transcript_36971/m.105148 type:complete len:312 (-) Transcript_36971:60-995(-)
MESRFDRHRFHNPSAWLDREERKKAAAEGRHPGYGFSVPRAPLPPKEERPFYVLEPAFTSGLMVHRKYSVSDPTYKTETERSDPYHYPNHLEVQEHHHFKDCRRRSQNIDPREWKPNPEFANIVTDDIVQKQLSAHLGQARAYTDPKLLNQLFDDTIRPQPHSLKELNCDLSCVDLPLTEGGPVSMRAARAKQARPGGSSGSSKGGGGADWSWCMGGRKPMDFTRPVGEKEMAIARTMSMPQLAHANQPSMLAGNVGGAAATFHGLNTRKFGAGKVEGAPDCRMRGSTLAKDGWAGGFPQADGVMHTGGPM